MTAPLNRFSVEPLARMTRRLADVAAGRAEPDLVITNARALSTYSERILPDREIWIAGGLNLGIDGRDAWVARIAQ